MVTRLIHEYTISKMKFELLEMHTLLNLQILCFQNCFDVAFIQWYHWKQLSRMLQERRGLEGQILTLPQVGVWGLVQYRLHQMLAEVFMEWTKSEGNHIVQLSEAEEGRV